VGKKYKKPTDPAEAARRQRALDAKRRGDVLASERLARRDPSKWGVNSDANALAANADVDIRPGVGGKCARARRFDCYRTHNRLSDDQIFAIQRLELDMAIAHRCEGREGQGEFVDRSAAPTELITSRSMEAADRVAEALSRVGPGDRFVFRRILELQITTGVVVKNWQGVITEVFGLVYKTEIAGALKSTAENLRQAYVEIDNDPLTASKFRGRKSSVSEVAPESAAA
jgi:hypothetical protein